MPTIVEHEKQTKVSAGDCRHDFLQPFHCSGINIYIFQFVVVVIGKSKIVVRCCSGSAYQSHSSLGDYPFKQWTTAAGTPKAFKSYISASGSQIFNLPKIFILLAFSILGPLKQGLSGKLQSALEKCLA
jgi:hypothetical protein